MICKNVRGMPFFAIYSAPMMQYMVHVMTSMNISTCRIHYLRSSINNGRCNFHANFSCVLTEHIQQVPVMDRYAPVIVGYDLKTHLPGTKSSPFPRQHVQMNVHEGMVLYIAKSSIRYSNRSKGRNIPGGCVTADTPIYMYCGYLQNLCSPEQWNMAYLYEKIGIIK